MNNSKTKKNLRKTLAVAACVPMLAALFTAVPAVQQANASTATDLVGEGNTYYEIESKDHQEAVSMLNQAQLEIAREGMVLLKNEDNVLPMAEGSNVTVFGNGQNKTSVRTNSITGALEEAGLKLNPTVKQFYQSSRRQGAHIRPATATTFPAIRLTRPPYLPSISMPKARTLQTMTTRRSSLYRA